MRIEREEDVLEVPLFHWVFKSGTWGSDYTALLATVREVDRFGVAHYKGLVTFAKHTIWAEGTTYTLDAWFGKGKRIVFMFCPKELNVAVVVTKEEG